ncbi:MAG: ABC transporter ATP-binding protein [Oscillospiraceae bacterium]|jgi:putative ABC transport system ATP-binding protein|nr:ABC transporter ATP-binding protein [Oscillospiraceae bacterium]
MSVMTLRDVSRLYHQGDETIYAVRQANLQVETGDFLSITGQSGAGKTTLLNLMGCVDKPTGGQIFIDGLDVTTASDEQLAAIRRQKIGYIFQDFNLIPILTAEENIIMPVLLDGKKPDKAYLAELAEMLGIAGRLRHLPGQLSGGQKQRVAIARALINRPSLILADEPTGNLDERTAEEIMRLLLKIHQNGNTLLLVTHEKQYADLAQRRCVIADGELSERLS